MTFVLDASALHRYSGTCTNAAIASDNRIKSFEFNVKRQSTRISVSLERRVSSGQTHMLLTLTIWIIITLSVLVVVLLIANQSASQVKTQALSLKEWLVVDLTQPLTSTIPIWLGDPDVEIQPWATIAQDGYFINRIALGEHSGTHWATPNSFVKGATSAEQKKT